MMIDINVLKSVNAETINFNSGEMIFREGDLPEFYYQIVIGSIKLVNRNLNDKEHNTPWKQSIQKMYDKMD